MSTAVLVFQASGFFLAPLLFGVTNKTKAWFAGRNGPPLIQPYYDLWRLLGKGAVYSETTTWVFRLGPPVGLAATGISLLVLPAGGLTSPLAFNGDIFLFAGLLATARFAVVISAMDTGSSFEGMGASREVTFGALAEPALFLSLSSLVLVTSQLSLSGAIASLEWPLWTEDIAPVFWLAAAALFVLMLVENSRIPVDDPNTHLELTMVHEVMVLDHSGPDFGYILYSSSLKMWLFASLIVGILYPLSMASPWSGGLLRIAGIMLIGVAVGVVESIMARVRMVQVPRLLVGCMVMGVLGVALAIAIR